MSTIPAHDLIKGDVVLLGVGWRNVIDVWESIGFTHVVATDSTGMWLNDEEVEVARRPQPPKTAPKRITAPKLTVVRPPSSRQKRHDASIDCGELHCVACWRAGRRPSPVHKADT